MYVVIRRKYKYGVICTSKSSFFLTLVQAAQSILRFLKLFSINSRSWLHPYTLMMLVNTCRLWLTSLCLVLSTTACATGPTQIEWVDCSQNVPSESVFNASGIDLTRLPTTLKCGQIAVPMDYSQPMSDCNIITLGLAMYRPVNPKGVIF